MKLEFGPSDYARWRSSHPNGEKAEGVTITDSGTTKLETISNTYIPNPKKPPRTTNIQGYSCVEMGLLSIDYSSSSSYQLYLLWNSKRGKNGEWVAVVHENWVEDAGMSDDRYYGPFALNATYKGQLAEAFGADLREFSPSQLDILARTTIIPTTEKEKINEGDIAGSGIAAFAYIADKAAGHDVDDSSYHG